MRSARFLLALSCISLMSCREEYSANSQDQVLEAEVDPPAVELAGWVTDAANILDEAQEEKLTAKLTKLEASTQHQMVIATVPSLEGRHIQSFTTDLGNAWGIGRKDIDDGIIILVAPNEREARIAVGYGLEETLTDEICAEVLESSVIPSFSRGDFYTGLDNGVDALVEALQ